VGLTGSEKETLYDLTHHAIFLADLLLDETVELGALHGSSSLQQESSKALAPDQTPSTWPRLVRSCVPALAA
jgi:hypothetical protein